jgi:plastocyanin
MLAAAAAVLAACGGGGTSSPDCMTFTDLTPPNTAVIAFGGNLGNVYVPKCAMVKVSQPITFNGDFTTHPLSQTSGAAAIPHTPSGTTVTFSIGTAGTYDYQCDVHHASGMTGEIKVVP